MKNEEWQKLKENIESGDTIEIIFEKEGRIQIKKVTICHIRATGLSLFSKPGTPLTTFIHYNRIEEIRRL